MKKLTDTLRKHPLLRTLLDLTGNSRMCVYTEPLFGIPYNLYLPFATLYMFELGLNDSQIGLLLSISFLLQIVICLFAGVVIDKFGRRTTVFVCDIVSWGIPCLLWTFAQGFTWFLAAVIFNSGWQLSAVAWRLLCTEDAEQQHLVHIHTWVMVAGQVAVFFAPLSSLFVARYSLVPTVRVLYAISFVMFMTKFIVLYLTSTETKNGVLRRKQTRNMPLTGMLLEYKTVLPQLFRRRDTVAVLLIMAMLNISLTVSATFFSLYATQNIGVAKQFIPLFAIARSVVMLPFIFFVQHRINALSIKKPLAAGIGLYALSNVLLLAPLGGYVSAALYVVTEAFAYAIVMPRHESLLILFVEEKERARLTSLMYVVVVGLAVPFGVISGRLSDVNRALPFVMNIVLYAAIAAVTLLMLPKPKLHVEE